MLLLDAMLWALCREIGTQCYFVGRGQTQEELLIQFVGHIIKVHRLGIDEVMTPENIRFHMRHFPF
jgi:predicted small metal-binding protein